jgi:hypothetical protein
MRGKVTAEELTGILKRYTGGDQRLDQDAERLVAAVEITGEGGERGITASEFIDAMSKPVEVSAVHAGFDPLSSYLQQVWWKRNPPTGGSPGFGGSAPNNRDLRAADAGRKASDRFAEWVSECGGSEAAAMALSGGGEAGEFRPATREALRQRLQELDALVRAVAVERIRPSILSSPCFDCK